MPKRLTIDVADLVIAFTDHDDQHVWILDTQTGELLFGDDSNPLDDAIEGDTSGRYLFVAHDDSRAGYRDMTDFIATVDDHRERALLDAAIQGGAAVRQFEDTLAQFPKERERWFEYQREQVLRRARVWLQSEGIEAI